jgi:hypothetical protein
MQLASCSPASVAVELTSRPHLLGAWLCAGVRLLTVMIDTADQPTSQQSLLWPTKVRVASSKYSQKPRMGADISSINIKAAAATYQSAAKPFSSLLLMVSRSSLTMDTKHVYTAVSVLHISSSEG